MGWITRKLQAGPAPGALLGLVLLALPAAAPRAEGASPPPGHNCTCRANGRSYALGERVCLLGPAGYRVAECRMAQNVTSWVLGAEDCSLSAGLEVRVARR
jgi:hypothetical protein